MSCHKAMWTRYSATVSNCPWIEHRWQRVFNLQFDNNLGMIINQKWTFTWLHHLWAQVVQNSTQGSSLAKYLKIVFGGISVQVTKYIWKWNYSWIINSLQYIFFFILRVNCFTWSSDEITKTFALALLSAGAMQASQLETLPLVKIHLRLPSFGMQRKIDRTFLLP